MSTQQTNKEPAEEIKISAPRFGKLQFRIVGIDPYMQHRFSKKVTGDILEKMAAVPSPTQNAKKVRKPKDIEQEYIDAAHFDKEGRYGIPALAIKSAMISACRLCKFTMKSSKLCFFVEADTTDAQDNSQLIFIEGEPEKDIRPARIGINTMDIRVRPIWQAGWKANVRITFDEDQLSAKDIANLLMRAGMQVGIGEGRPDSTDSDSPGLGLGRFTLEGA